MPKTLTLTAVVPLDVAVPAHAAEPAATSRSTAGCTAWRAGFQTKTRNEITRKSGFGRCVSPTTEKLAVERRAAREGAGGAFLTARRRSDLATRDSPYANLGCIENGGRPIRPERAPDCGALAPQWGVGRARFGGGPAALPLSSVLRCPSGSLVRRTCTAVRLVSD